SYAPPSSPPGTVILATGTNPKGGADMIYYPTSAGGFVFSASSLSFIGSLVVDPDLQIIVQNAINTTLTPAEPIFSNLNAPQITSGTALTTIYGRLDPKSHQSVPTDETVKVTLNGVTQNDVLIVTA